MRDNNYGTANEFPNNKGALDSEDDALPNRGSVSVAPGDTNVRHESVKDFVLQRLREMGVGGTPGSQTPPSPSAKLAYPFPICRHVMPSGARCNSPRLRGNHLFCYFHNRLLDRKLARRGHSSTASPLDLPVPEDRAAVKISLHEIMRALIANEISERKAGILIYGLQVAMQASPLPKQAVNLPMETSVVEDDENGEHVPFTEEEQEEAERHLAELSRKRAIGAEIKGPNN